MREGEEEAEGDAPEEASQEGEDDVAEEELREAHGATSRALEKRFRSHRSWSSVKWYRLK